MCSPADSQRHADVFPAEKEKKYQGKIIHLDLLTK
jgi:hypothetical protein